MSGDGDAFSYEGGEANDVENFFDQDGDGIFEPYVGMIELKGEKWVVIKLVKEHSHSVMSLGKVHHLHPRRHFVGDAKATGDSYQGVGIGVVPSGVIYVSMDGNCLSTDANNHDI
ncbi:hypothetical protein V6N11_071636 [Hibiscus sabdariffa]|uniref:Uncharacterized protein n=1 Tax=Hibiscus sabdariffa TaxID=183260 RepID=A0ABR2U0L8_9ROSI